MIYLSTRQAKGILGTGGLLGGGLFGGGKGNPLALKSPPRDKRRNVDGKFKKVLVDHAKMFRTAWDRHAGPDALKLEREYAFAADIEYTDRAGRKRRRGWRFDFAIPELLIAVEVDGNAWNTKGGGRHATDTDRDKMNEAAARGWAVFRFSPQQLKADRAEASVTYVLRAIEARRYDAARRADAAPRTTRARKGAR